MKATTSARTRQSILPPDLIGRGWKLSSAFLAGMLLLAGCSSESSPFQMSNPSTSAVRSAQTLGRENGELRRFVAVSHEVTVEASEDDLPKAWEAIEAYCRTIPCEIMASSIRQKTSEEPPYAELSLRVDPNHVGDLLKRIETVGKIIRHQTNSEDKTETVIDVEAKLKNLTQFRDSLRNMLTSAKGDLKDIVEVQRQLANVQSELDSLQTKRKVLANETEKVMVNVSFCTEHSTSEPGVLSPIISAFHNSGPVLSGSIAALIIFVVAVVPWLVILIPALWLCIKGLRKLRRKRTNPAGK